MGCSWLVICCARLDLRPVEPVGVARLANEHAGKLFAGARTGLGFEGALCTSLCSCGCRHFGYCRISDARDFAQSICTELNQMHPTGPGTRPTARGVPTSQENEDTRKEDQRRFQPSGAAHMKTGGFLFPRKGTQKQKKQEKKHYRERGARNAERSPGNPGDLQRRRYPIQG